MSASRVEADQRLPAWREPMLWLVAVLPLTVIVAAAFTLNLARGGTDAVVAAVRRTAQVQIADLSSDRAALALDAQAQLTIDGATRVAQLTLIRVDEPAGLELLLIHPVDASRDRRVPLVRDGDRWTTPLPPSSHDWLLQLSPPDGRWRLVGRLTPGQEQVHLRSALRE